MLTINRVAVLLGAAMFPASGIADTTLSRTQTFTVSAQIVAGCGVVGGGSGTGLDLGTLDFGTYPAVATGEANAMSGGTALQIECSPGSMLKMTIDGGRQMNAGDMQRNLQGTGGALIAYWLYADAAHAQAIAVGQAVSFPVSGRAGLPIYGVLTLPGGSKPPGTYTDTAQVTLSY